jgi:hypothetical protein
LKEENRLREYGSRMVRKILAPKNNEVTEEWRILQ